MKPIKTFIIGSRVFFSEIKGFLPKDYDELNLMDRFNFNGNVLHCKIHGKDVFFFRNMDKEGFIKDALDSNVPMRVGKFLVPEFAVYLGMTIDDLKRLKPLFDAMDEKHKYEKVIYSAYIKNKAFRLTDGQRQKAYEAYKESRV